MIQLHDYETNRLKEIVPARALAQIMPLRHRSSSSHNPAILAGVLEPIIVYKKVVVVVNESGSFARDKVITLMLPAGATVHISLCSEAKCRADMAVCREIGTSHRSSWDPSFVYEAGLLKPRRPFSQQIGKVCGQGIHLFFRRQAAEDYNL